MTRPLSQNLKTLNTKHFCKFGSPTLTWNNSSCCPCHLSPVIFCTVFLYRARKPSFSSRFRPESMWYTRFPWILFAKSSIQNDCLRFESTGCLGADFRQLCLLVSHWIHVNVDVSSQMSERFDGFFQASNCELEARTNSQNATGYCYGLQVNAAVHPAFRLK